MSLGARAMTKYMPNSSLTFLVVLFLFLQSRPAQALVDRVWLPLYVVW
jgi:hypothetical protein